MGFGLDEILPLAGSAIGGYLGGTQGAAVGGILGSGVGGAMASNQASQQQQDSINQAIAYNQALYKSSQQQLAPYQAAGLTATNQLMGLLGLSGSYQGNLKNINSAINTGPAAQTATTATAGKNDTFLDSIFNVLDPGDLTGLNKTPGSSFGSLQSFRNVLDPGNVTGANPAAGNANPYVSAGGDLFAAYFGGKAAMGALGAANASKTGGTTQARATGGPVQGGNTFVVGEEGPEVLHMFPGSQGYVTPNPRTQARMMGHRALGGPVAGSPVNYGATPPNPYSGNNTALTGGQTPAQIMKMDPSYQFQMQQGVQALDHSAAASGGLLTGGHLKDLMTFGQGLASQDFNNIYNRLAGVSSMGLGASSTSGQFGMFNGSNVGGLMTASGQAGANGTIAGFNGMTGSLGNLFSGGGNPFSSLFGGGSPSGGGSTVNPGDPGTYVNPGDPGTYSGYQ